MRVKSYPKYRDSGVEWLGEIPEHWQMKRLRYCCQLNMGQSPSSEDCNIDEVGVPFLQGNAEFGELYPTPKQYCEVTRKISKKGDMLISVRAPVGALNIADQNYGIGRGLCAITVKEAVLANRFCWYLLHEIRQQLNFQSRGSTYEAVSSEDVGNLMSILPSLEEQRTIAAFLDRETYRIDQLIARKERQIELLQEKRSALISHAVTKGLNPKAKMKDSGIEWLGEIPEHWRVCTFKRVATMSYGVGGELDRTLTEGIKILSLPNVGIDGTLMLDDIPYGDLTEDQKPALLLQRGDLLFNWRNGSSKHLGKTAYFYIEGEYTHVSFLLRIRFNPEQHESRYFQLLLNGFQITGFFASSKAGVNNTFNRSELENLWVMVPPLHEQKDIAHYLGKELSQIDKLISKIVLSISKLHEYRIAIISAAVTGKIDVSKEAA